jgi:hypothetical protein
MYQDFRVCLGTRSSGSPDPRECTIGFKIDADLRRRRMNDDRLLQNMIIGHLLSL